MRLAHNEHEPGDVYDVVPDTGYSDDEAHYQALLSAMTLMPALRERIESRLDQLAGASRGRLALVMGGAS